MSDKKNSAILILVFYNHSSRPDLIKIIQPIAGVYTVPYLAI